MTKGRALNRARLFCCRVGSSNLVPSSWGLGRGLGGPSAGSLNPFPQCPIARRHYPTASLAHEHGGGPLCSELMDRVAQHRDVEIAGDVTGNLVG